MLRFDGIIDARVGQNTVEEGEYSLSIELNVETDNLDLNLDTDENYQLELSSTDNNELIASISAFCYFGARHGLETLSQLIAYDEFTNQLKVRIHLVALHFTCNFACILLLDPCEC